MRKGKKTGQSLRWKKEQEQKKRKQKKRDWFQRLKVGVVGVVMFIGILGARWWWAREWREGERFSFVVIAESESKLKPVWWVSVDPLEEEGVVVYFSQEVMIDTVGGYGGYRVWALPELGKLEKRGLSLVAESLQLLMGIKTDGALIVNLTDEEGIRWLRQVVREGLVWGYKGDMNMLDRLKLWRVVSGFNDGSVEWVDVANSRFGYIEQLPDGSGVVKVDLLRWDGWIQQNFKDEKVLVEALSVGVINQTDHGQLGKKAGRMLINTGIDVVAVETGEGSREKSVIKISNKEVLKTDTLDRIKDLYHKVRVETGGVETERFDVVVEVGEDFWQWLNGD